jgi:hypothetical protein
MSTTKGGESLQDLIRQILDGSPGGANPATLREARRFFNLIVRHDYAKALKKQFDAAQLRDLLRELRRALPDLNRRVFSELRIERLARKAADLGATLKAEPFEGENGCALRGFYLSADTNRRKPMVYVNTAREPIGIAAAFWHELGHHLTHDILGAGKETLFLSFSADYASHLKSIDELAADIVMTLGCYPKQAAQRVFGSRSSKGTSADSMIMSARQYVHSVTGLDFDRSTAAQENVYRLAGMIHLAKLREALLSEYGI